MSNIPGYGDGTSQKDYTCDNGVYRHTISSSWHKDITITMAERDGGWRVWYSGVTPGDSFNSAMKLDKYLASTATGMIARTIEANWYALTIISGASNGELSTDNWPINVTGTDLSLQITQYESANQPDSNSAMPVFDGNGGTWSDERIRTPLIKNNELADWTKANTPIRDSYEFKGWATDAAGQHPVDANAKVSVGTHLYAQWEKAAGDPQKVDLDCSTGGRCELTVNYSGSTAKTREFQPGSGALAWSGSPVTGVRLDASGYAADGACSDTRCWYVSLDKEPNQQGSYQAQMPTTGAPEGLSTVGLIAVAVSLLGLTFAASRRNRS